MGQSNGRREFGPRRILLLIGKGNGPKVAIRSTNMRLRISGLISGKILLDLDGTHYEFDSDGEHPLPGGEFAMATNIGGDSVVCEVLTGV